MIENFWKFDDGELSEFLLKLSASDAAQLFREFLAIKEERLNVIRQLVTNDGLNCNTLLDYSPTSLVPFWAWIRRKLSHHKYSQEELKTIEQLPAISRQGRLEFPPLTEVTRRRILDASIYFGEVFTNNYTSVEWKLHKSLTKRDAYANHPELTGFSQSMSPFHLVRTASYGSLSEIKGDQRLLELYEIWKNKLVDR